jgi:hypothetical protein
MYQRHLPFILPALLGAAVLPARAGATVTICNQSGQDVWLTQAGLRPPCPVRVLASEGGAGQDSRRLLARLARPAVLVEPGAGAPSGAAPEAGPAVPTTLQHLLRNGETVFLAFDRPEVDLASELVLYHLAGDEGVVLDGILVFSVSHKPAPAPDLPPVPEARLVRPEGPTPGTAVLPCCRRLKRLPESKLSDCDWLLQSESAAAAELAGALQPSPDQP